LLSYFRSALDNLDCREFAYHDDTGQKEKKKVMRSSSPLASSPLFLVARLL
jgi:hypothetical protein